MKLVYKIPTRVTARTPLPVDVYPSQFIISLEDAEAALLSTKLHSAPGPVEIRAWFLRENASTLYRALRFIFNLSPPSRLCLFLVEIS
jgi:hypothetical protein